MDAKGALGLHHPRNLGLLAGRRGQVAEDLRRGPEGVRGQPSLDASTGTYAVQLSALVSDEGGKIGALTLTLKVPR